MHDDFLGLEGEVKKTVTKFEKETGNLKGTLMMVNKDVKDMVLEDLYSKVKKVSNMVPIVEELSIEALKARHWTKIFDLLAGDVSYVEGRPFCLSELIEWGIMDIKDKVEEISSTAAGEFSLETTLREIKEKWEETVFTLNNYREQKDKFYITQVEDILTQLEDHQVSVQTMLGNRNASEIRGIIEEWDKKLRTIQDVIDE